MQKRRSPFPLIPCLVMLLLICGIKGTLGWLAISFHRQALQTFGVPASSLGTLQEWSYSLQLAINSDRLTRPVDASGTETEFTIRLGETAGSIAAHLSENGLIPDADIFRTYLIYSGLDTRIQAGKYKLSPRMSPIEIAQKLQDATPGEVEFGVLEGWRIEEIAAALPTSGLDITPQEFIDVTRNLEIAPGLKSELPSTATLEGFLAPGSYTFKRDISVGELILEMTDRSQKSYTTDMLDGFTRHGLSLFQAVTLASIVQREAMIRDEQPTIASVFYNRIAAGMKLDSDPTVQYALGYNNSRQTWWTNPLTAADLQTDSPYNTYIYEGLPPGPISNPGISALQAVANPDQTSYLYFRARCDGTHRHFFATTYEEHLNNQCQQ